MPNVTVTVTEETEESQQQLNSIPVIEKSMRGSCLCSVPNYVYQRNQQRLGLAVLFCLQTGARLVPDPRTFKAEPQFHSS